MLPYHITMANSSAECMGAPRMSYPTDVAMWNEGRMDRWNIARNPGYGMGYFERDDLPYYYALSDGFTVGDAYYQSTFTETSPNRIHLFSGSNNNCKAPASLTETLSRKSWHCLVLLSTRSTHRGPSAVMHRLAHALVLPCGRPRSVADHDPKGRGSNPDKDWLLMNDAEAHDPGYDWPTMAETLEESGVSWKVYMSVGYVLPFDRSGPASLIF